MTDYQVKFRIVIFQIIIVVVFFVFVGQLVRLQILEGEQYRQLADRNRFQTVEIDAPRGIIYDRNGNLLVRNRPIYDVTIVPAYLPDDTTDRAEVFAKLADLLNLPITNSGVRSIPDHNAYFRSFLHHEYTRLPGRQVRNTRSRKIASAPKGIQDAVEDAPPFAPYQPVIVATDISAEAAATIEQNRLNFPGVFVQTASKREYLTGELTSDVLGYVGPIPPTQTDRYPTPLYNPNDDVGLVGVESSYEQALHGSKGEELVEVDVTGRKIKTIGTTREAQPGNNITLTIDTDLQQFATDALQTAIDDSPGQSGAAVVLNAQTGEILAMVSLPTYDNNLFAEGISAREYSLLAEDERTPLVNKAIGGLYPPGSTFKVVVAAGALQEKTVSPRQQFVCQGVLYLPNKFFPDDPDLAQPFYCWYRKGHGPMDVVSGMANSCDVYFYQVGGGYEPSGYEGLGLDKLIEYSERFGFGAPTNIDIPGEGAGLVPSPKWKRLNYAETWVTGDTYNMSIGQGFVLSTPLQVANAYAAIGNGGTLYKPHVVQAVRNPQQELIYRAEPEVLGKLNVDAETLDWVREGLRAVIDWGTAAGKIDVPGITVAGKTGTAEFCDRYPQCLDKDGRVKTSHAWFAAYAPAENPEIAVVAFVYGGGEGSVVAAPVVNSILRYYFGFDRPSDAETNSGTDQTPSATGGKFTARLLGSDQFSEQAAAVNGYVLDATGKGIGGVTIEIIANDETVAQVVTGPTGQFDYNALDPQLADTWTIQLVDFPANPIKLSVSSSTRYFVEFQAEQ